MDTTTIQSANPQQLARLLDPESETITVYHGTDPALIFRHEMQAPLADELLSPILPPPAEPLSADPSIKTLNDLLHHEHPPIDLLKRAKDFAKVCRSHPELLPPEVATVLYYAIIAVAWLRYDLKITTLPPKEVESGLQWAAAQPWLDESVAKLLRDTIDHLHTV